MAKATTTINLTPAELQAIIDTAVAQALKAQSAQTPKAPKTTANAVKAEVKPVKAPKSESKKTQKPDVVGKSGYGYRVLKDVDTRDNSTLWVVKVIDSLSREEYMKEQASMKTLGGYYSRFKGGFIFRYDPASALKSGKAPKGAVRAEYQTKKGVKRV